MTAGDDRPSGVVGWLRWVRETDHSVVVYLREILSSVLVVLLVGALLFGVSGIWPPMVAVESGSMEPHMQRGDLVFVMEEHRLSPDRAYGDTGVVTHRIGQQTGYTKFGAPGDVIVYQRDGQTGETPIIHRAIFWVNESENWYEKADSDAIGGADSCDELRNCPAPHAGFITKGDNDATNQNYDQVSGLSAPVKPGWVVGTAEFSIPWLGNIRLWATGVIAPGNHGTAGYAPATVEGSAPTTVEDSAPATERQPAYEPHTVASPAPAAAVDPSVAHHGPDVAHYSPGVARYGPT